MSRIFKAIAEFANLFHGMFGTTLKRPFCRQSLEEMVGQRATRVILSVPVITVTVWLLVWVGAKVLNLPAGEDPFSWIRQITQ